MNLSSLTKVCSDVVHAVHLWQTFYLLWNTVGSPGSYNLLFRASQLHSIQPFLLWCSTGLNLKILNMKACEYILTYFRKKTEFDIVCDSLSMTSASWYVTDILSLSLGILAKDCWIIFQHHWLVLQFSFCGWFFSVHLYFWLTRPKRGGGGDFKSAVANSTDGPVPFYI